MSMGVQLALGLVRLSIARTLGVGLRPSLIVSRLGQVALAIGMRASNLVRTDRPSAHNCYDQVSTALTRLPGAIQRDHPCIGQSLSQAWHSASLDSASGRGCGARWRGGLASAWRSDQDAADASRAGLGCIYGSRWPARQTVDPPRSRNLARVSAPRSNSRGHHVVFSELCCWTYARPPSWRTGRSMPGYRC